MASEGEESWEPEIGSEQKEIRMRGKANAFHPSSKALLPLPAERATASKKPDAMRHA
jgi:hypothetical protein